MSVVIEFWCTEGVGMEGHWVDFPGIGLNGKDSTKGIVRSVSTMMGLLGIQWVKIGAEVKADFRASKASLTESEKFHAVPLQVSQVSRTTMLE